MPFPEITAEISARALLANIRTFRACCKPATKICLPLKANAYGHGLGVVAPIVQPVVDVGAVATLDEAIELRRAGWTKPILVFGAILSASDRRARIQAALDHKLTLTVADDEPLIELSKIAKGRSIDVHLKIDSGMGRMGTPVTAGLDLIRKVKATPSLNLAGIYSHFGAADLADPAMVDLQLAQFRNMLKSAGRLLGKRIIRHFANTAATLTRPDAHFDMVRPGIGAYGLLPADRFLDTMQIGKSVPRLRPAMRVVSRVSFVKALPANHCVGYGCAARTNRTTRLGIIPAGYHDGFLRALWNRAVVGTAHGDAPVMGRISMDQLAIDLTDRPAVVAGSPITLIDPDPARPNSVESLARLLGTISYEVVCVLGPRIFRTRVK